MPTDLTFVYERLTVPVHWWLLGTAFVLSIGMAFLAFWGPLWGVAVAVAGELLLLAGLLGYGGVRVVVGTDGIGVGRAWIGYEYVGRVTALDSQQTLHRLRIGADPRAHLVVRPYIPSSLEITVDDPADPHPYWLVSVRDPDRLARAVTDRLDRADG